MFGTKGRSQDGERNQIRGIFDDFEHRKAVQDFLAGRKKVSVEQVEGRPPSGYNNVRPGFRRDQNNNGGLLKKSFLENAARGVSSCGTRTSSKMDERTGHHWGLEDWGAAEIRPGSQCGCNSFGRKRSNRKRKSVGSAAIPKRGTGSRAEKRRPPKCI